MANRLDLTKCPIVNIRRKAQELLDSVAGGTHPLRLGGCVIKATKNTAISVPVGRDYRLLFTSETLLPIAFLSHEQYNKSIRHSVKQ
jgi:hypothetical protein